MRPLLLHLDGALGSQKDLAARAHARGGIDVEAHDLGPALRLWSRPAALESLRLRLAVQADAQAGPLLTFAGSGDFHHVSHLLIERAVRVANEPITVIHFDNHPDWVRHRNGMHCGSWVANAARLQGVQRMITVGVCSKDICSPANRSADLSLLEDGLLELYAYRIPGGARSLKLCGREWPAIEALGESRFAALLASRIPTRHVYITIDKDVLCAHDAVTNWDQGRTTFGFLQLMLRNTARDHVVIGADVVGDWSRPVYAGIRHGMLKRAEAFLDQPARRPGPAELLVNERVNLSLLQLFGELT
jgi:hypothetical protein